MITLAAVVLACSLHSDHELITAIARANSQGNPLVVRNVGWTAMDAQDDRSSFASPLYRSEAHRTVSRVLSRGGTPIIGLLPVPLAWAKTRNWAPARMFNACDNVRIASAKVKTFDHRCRKTGSSAKAAKRRACTLRHYGRSVQLGSLSLRAQSYLRGSGASLVAWSNSVKLDSPLPFAASQPFKLSRRAQRSRR